MIIPISELAPDTLQAVIEEFVLREGTDYGEQEVSLDRKVQQIHQQLKQGVLVLVYSELHETVNILPKDQFQQQH